MAALLKVTHGVVDATLDDRARHRTASKDIAEHVDEPALSLWSIAPGRAAGISTVSIVIPVIAVIPIIPVVAIVTVISIVARAPVVAIVAWISGGNWRLCLRGLRAQVLIGFVGKQTEERHCCLRHATARCCWFRCPAWPMCHSIQNIE